MCDSGIHKSGTLLAQWIRCTMMRFSLCGLYEDTETLMELFVCGASYSLQIKTKVFLGQDDRPAFL